jgi:hypothetical protein
VQWWQVATISKAEVAVVRVSASALSEALSRPS